MQRVSRAAKRAKAKSAKAESGNGRGYSGEKGAEEEEENSDPQQDGDCENDEDWPGWETDAGVFAQRPSTPMMALSSVLQSSATAAAVRHGGDRGGLLPHSTDPFLTLEETEQSEVRDPFLLPEEEMRLRKKFGRKRG